MIRELGYCSGIENYSRYLSGRAEGEPPPCLFDYVPPDALLIVDESHVTVPQLGGMYRGDRSRKETLVEYGFRLPSALDNRPLQFEEWEKLVKQVTGADVGFAGPVGLDEEIPLLADEMLNGQNNLITGCNETDFHCLNVNLGRDCSAPEYHDLRLAKAGERSPDRAGVLKEARGISGDRHYRKLYSGHTRGF